jgi:hypothetical protein
MSGQKPLDFDSITLADTGENVLNASDIPTSEPKFKLQFDKNVVNSTIWGINQNCFTLVSQENQSVPLSVTKIDDTIDFSQRQLIWIQPAAPLSPGTTYTLEISPALKAKNGVSTLGGSTGGNGRDITFKTSSLAATPTSSQTESAFAQPSQPVGQVAGQADNTGSANGQLQGNSANSANRQLQSMGTPPTGSVGKVNIATNTPQQAGMPQGVEQKPVVSSIQSSAQKKVPVSSHHPGLNSATWLPIGACALIVGWIAVEVFMKRKKKTL